MGAKAIRPDAIRPVVMMIVQWLSKLSSDCPNYLVCCRIMWPQHFVAGQRNRLPKNIVCVVKLVSPQSPKGYYEKVLACLVSLLAGEVNQSVSQFEELQSWFTPSWTGWATGWIPNVQERSCRLNPKCPGQKAGKRAPARNSSNYQPAS